MNPQSQKTKNQNLLNTKTKHFKETLLQSQKRMRSSSSLHNLAGKLYSQKVNRVFSPKKRGKQDFTSTMRNSSITKSNNQKIDQNPETNLKSAMGGLTLRTYHVPCFAELNLQLLTEKKNLEDKINYLKQAIKQQKKKLSHAQYTAKKNQNQADKFKEFYNQAHLNSSRLQQQIAITNNQNRNLQKDIKLLQEQINNRKTNIECEANICNSLQTSTKNLKSDLIRTQKEKINEKTELSKNQKVMQSYSIETKQLQNVRALLLIEINQSVDVYKI